MIFGSCCLLFLCAASTARAFMHDSLATVPALIRFVLASEKERVGKIAAAFPHRDQFEFQIYRRGFFSDLAKRLGMQDIEVGHPDFDRNFIVKGSNESKLRQLFENARIREFVSAQPRIDFKIETGEPRPGSIESEAELKFTSVGVIKDVDRLKQLFDLFAETLDQLNRMGTASPPPTEGART